MRQCQRFEMNEVSVLTRNRVAFRRVALQTMAAHRMSPELSVGIGLVRIALVICVLLRADNTVNADTCAFALFRTIHARATPLREAVVFNRFSGA